LPLKIPLTLEQVRSAGRVHDRLDQWRLADESLRALGRAFPDFDATSCLLKVVAVNSLYGTNLYATLRMASHLRGVLADAGRPTEVVPLVELIADLPPRNDDEKRRHFASFASKFVHFFVDEAAPIYDSYAEKTLKAHLGRRRGIWKGSDERPYEAFVRNLGVLRSEAGLEVDARKLDRYLWLVGQAREWQRRRTTGKKETTNRELAEMLRSPSEDVTADLSLVLGEPWPPQGAPQSRTSSSSASSWRP